MVLSTTSFTAERRSVLHSGIFNRELASSLAAGALILLLSFFFALYLRITVISLAAATLLFAGLFIFFRLAVFREAILETVFERDRGTVTLSRKRGIGSRVRSYSLDRLRSIGVGHLSMQPENIDAVRLVERVALQHGTVIPGFGKTEDIYTVELDFDGEKPVIFSSRDREAAESLLSELRASLSGLLPETVW